MDRTRRAPSSLAATLAVLSLGIGLPAWGQNDVMTFPRGSLIIPMQSNFQSQCGITAAYGLVWKILQSNQPGHYNGGHPVTIYLAINGTKGSPNRCVPSNRHKPPPPTTGAWNDPAWNDGCDLGVHNLTEQPVVPVDYSVAFPATGMYPDAPIPEFSGVGLAKPAYPAIGLLNNTASPRFTDIQYLGGPFIIHAQDAMNVINFLKSGSDPVATQYITPGTCSFPQSAAGTPDYFVQMHQATIQFTATIARRINTVPPKVAVLDTSSDNSGGGSVASGILGNYLINAGLNFAGATGCPPGTFSACVGAPGLIYDTLDANSDLVSTATNPYGLLNSAYADGGYVYNILWTPHWVGTDSTYPQYVPNGDAATTEIQNALNNINHFLNRRNTGLMAECASIETYEGSVSTYSRWGTQPRYSALTDFMYTNFADINDLVYPPSKATSYSSWDGQNCTDPDYGTSPNKDCMVFPNPGDPFSQLGDFHFHQRVGLVQDFNAAVDAGSVQRPFAKPLAVSWYNYSPGLYDGGYDPAPSQDMRNFFMTELKGNSTAKATIVYLAGHDYSDDVAGNRIVLNTLLNLGGIPLGQERDLAAPVAYDDVSDAGNAIGPVVFTATFESVSGYGTSSSVSVYNPSQGSQWVYPLTPGHLRAHPLTGAGSLMAGNNALSAATLFDAAAEMPSPGQRNVFTYLGGYVSTTSSPPTGLATAPSGSVNGVAQFSWVPETVSGAVLGASGCVDVMSYGKVVVNGTPQLGMVPNKSDGMCDLQQALETTTVNAGTDYGVSEVAANKALLSANLSSDQQMLQVVRGYCFATSAGMDGAGTPILTPTQIQCNNPNATDTATLGGFIHSAPAIIGPSLNIQDQGASRPTIAYAGGTDGQLHAFYVSGGSGYMGPVNALTPVNPVPTSKFVHDYAADFAGGTLPPQGTELWSFLPASQLPYLKGNNATVDSSPVVMDVFIDLNHTGIRSWHTVLVSSTGPTSREVFALDITNPLRPFLLWDLVGSLAPAPVVPYSPVTLADDATGGTAYAYKFSEPRATFQLPRSSDPGASGRGLYDYTDLGGALGVSLGEMRLGTQPVYAAFVAASSSGINAGKGLEVYAIEVGTGQLLWQWEEPYTNASLDSDNAAPPPVTVTRDGNGISNVWVGDMEGNLWELDAESGVNVNTFVGPGCATPCKLTAFSTQGSLTNPQPLTTNIGTAVLPTSAQVDGGTGGALFAFAGANVLLVGTAGSTWVPAAAAGELHVLLMDARYQVPYAKGGSHLDGGAWSQPSALTYARASGILQEPAPFPVVMHAGDHLYGDITVAGTTAFFETAQGKGDPNDVANPMIDGGTYSIDLAAVTAANPYAQLASQANFAGVTVLHVSNAGGGSQDFIVGANVNSLSNTIVVNPGSVGDATPNGKLKSAGNGSSLYRIKTWFTGLWK